MLPLLKQAYNKLVSTNIHENTHTNVALPNDSTEYSFSPGFFWALNAAGYCIKREDIVYFIRWAKEILNDDKLIDELSSFNTWSFDLSSDIEFICLFPSAPMAQTKNPTLDIVKLASLRNHERLHAQTLRYETDWYTKADSLLIDYIGNIWYELSDQIIHLENHNQLLNKYGVIWVAVTETLARTSAVLHTSKEYRHKIAAYQINNKPQLLLLFSTEFEKIFGSVEYFVDIVNNFIEPKYHDQ